VVVVYHMFLKKNAVVEINLGEPFRLFLTLLDEIKRRIYFSCEGADVALVEIGGTVGDIESQPFLRKAIRSVKSRIRGGVVHCLCIDMVPYIRYGGVKQKPSQLSISVKRLSFYRYSPIFLFCRS